MVLAWVSTTPLGTAAGTGGVLDHAGLIQADRLVDGPEVGDPVAAGNAEAAWRDLSCPLDEARCFTSMVTYNGGRPLRCLA